MFYLTIYMFYLTIIYVTIRTLTMTRNLVSKKSKTKVTSFLHPCIVSSYPQLKLSRQSEFYKVNNIVPLEKCDSKKSDIEVGIKMLTKQ